MINNDTANRNHLFEVFVPTPAQPDACGWFHFETPETGYFKNVSWGLHASTGAVCAKAGQRVVFRAFPDNSGVYLPSAGGYIVENN